MPKYTVTINDYPEVTGEIEAVSMRDAANVFMDRMNEGEECSVKGPRGEGWFEKRAREHNVFEDYMKRTI